LVCGLCKTGAWGQSVKCGHRSTLYDSARVGWQQKLFQAPPPD
jgi:hypothetical protein